MAKLKPITLTHQNMVQVISEQTGLPEDMVRRIVLFMNFAIYTKDGKLTKFAKQFNIAGYNDLYNFLKKTKELYRNDHEIEAFSIRYNTMFKSLQPRTAAWIFNTFVKFDNEKDDKDKYITANLYAVSFINRTFGQTMENLKLFQKIVKAMDRAKKEVSKFVEGLQYQGSEAKEDK